MGRETWGVFLKRLDTLEIIGIDTRVNSRWEFCEGFTGEIVFYGGGLEFSSYFVDGILKGLHRP